MEITKHLGFSKQLHRELWDYVLENNIPVNQQDRDDIVSMDILTCNPHWPWIADYVQNHKVVCTSDTIFSRKELQEAQWLRVRSTWRYGYPEPQNAYDNGVTYSRDAYCDACGAGKIQTDFFRTKRVPSWGRRHFFSLYWVEDELFISDAAKVAMINAGISGISFWDVKKTNGIESFSGIQQLYIHKILDEGLVEDESFIRKVVTCPKCGRKKYLHNGCGKMKFKKDIFYGAYDIVKTTEVFGGMPFMAASEIIISQKAYQAITQAYLDRGLMFYPIDLE